MIAINQIKLLVIMYVNFVLTLKLTFKNNTRILGANFKRKQCGQDNLPEKTVKEGPANIEQFPWLGMLLYPYDSPRQDITTIILISRQIAVAAALDIDHYPKDDFRSRSRVILGTNCTKQPTYRVIDYSFHPDFSKSTYSTLAIVQVDTRAFKIKVFPICAPPEEFENPDDIYALTLTRECANSSMVTVHKMFFVDMRECREFYRKAELDIASMWPTHVACGRGLHGGHCVWQSGTALIIRERGQWKLLGVGIFGPGCESPARFIDYGMHHNWVRQAMFNIGKPAISRIAPNIIVLRRTLSSIQRFGLCDLEEAKLEIFTDSIYIQPPYTVEEESVKYNLTLLDHMDYNCIVLRVENEVPEYKLPTPQLTLQRWCTDPKPICAEFSKTNVYFFIEIRFRNPCILKISAYGSEIKYVESKDLMRYANSKRSYPLISETKFGSQ